MATWRMNNLHKEMITKAIDKAVADLTRAKQAVAAGDVDAVIEAVRDNNAPLALQLAYDARAARDWFNDGAKAF